MAERRMFAKTIVLSDAFLDMPLSARCLYFTLGMLADDDGFVNSPKSIMRQCGAQEDDMRILIAKKFVLVFDSGVIVIKHWRINNYLRSDRYVETKYVDEKSSLTVDDSGIYHAGIPGGIPNSGIPSIGKDRLGKESIGKDIEGADKFTPPTMEDVVEYAKQRNSSVDPKVFYDYFTEGKWKDSKGNKVRNWKQKFITWERQGGNENKPVSRNAPAACKFSDEYNAEAVKQMFADLDALGDKI